MMSGSSLSRLRALALTAVGLALLQAVVEAFGGQLGVLNGLLCAGVVATGVYTLFLIRRLETAVRRASMVCKAVAGGDLEVRISGIQEGGDLGEKLWSVNGLRRKFPVWWTRPPPAISAVVCLPRTRPGSCCA